LCDDDEANISFQSIVNKRCANVMTLRSAVDMEASMGDGKDTNEHANDDSNNQMQEDSS